MNSYSFTGEVWLWSAQDSWHFVTLPEDLSDEIDEKFGSNARGFGSLRVDCSIGTTRWSTSIFPSKSAAAYVLPLKAQVRKDAGIGEGDRVTIELVVQA